MKTCEDCGCRVYEYGCVNCNEADYIDMQNEYDESDVYATPDPVWAPVDGPNFETPEEPRS